MGVQAEVDDVVDAEGVDVDELRFGRLAGCSGPIVERRQY